jgi:hypothetical protein
MRAAAALLLQATNMDMEKLLKSHDPEAEFSSVVFGVARDEKAAGFDFRHLPVLTEEAVEYAKGHVAKRRNEIIREAKKAEEVEKRRISFDVDCGLLSKLNRSVPTMIIGQRKAVNRVIGYALNAAHQSAEQPKILHYTAVGPYTADRVKVVPFNEWVGTYNAAQRSGAAEADLFVVDDALEYCQPVYHANNKPDYAPDRVLRVARKLRGVCRSCNAAILFGVPIGEKERVSDYVKAQEFTYPVTADIEGSEIVVRDLSGTRRISLTYRKPAK